LEGTQPPDEMIQWISHTGLTTRSVEDTALMLDVLAERNEHAREVSFSGDLAKGRDLRIGIANNFKADKEVSTVFEKAVETIRGFGHATSEVAAPFWHLNQGIGKIEADRKTASEVFKSIDVLILPTIPTTTPSVIDAGKNPQALSADHTVFANYYGLPAISVPCGFDMRGLPLGLQIVGKPWNDSVVLRLAYQYQEATEFVKKHPSK
jgi:aspartyl-tRNA(Asn)/glutamyl-tRNA(Gln) amidotransferase subunit A